MIPLQPTIDYRAIKEVKDLPFSWISTHDQDIKAAGNYEKECKTHGVDSNRTKIAELIRNKTAHLRQTTLENGLRYVTIHLKEGEQIFDEHEYAGLISCNCEAIHDSPSVKMADAIRGTNLGDGIKLNMTISGHSKGYGSTASYAEKEFEVDGKKVKVHYSITPESVHEDGRLTFSYEVNTPGLVNYKVKNLSNDGRIETKTKPITAKHLKLEVCTAATSETDYKNNPYCRSSILISHNLNSPYNEKFDKMEFKFRLDGTLDEIVGISQGTNPNPEWTDKQVLVAIKKGQNDWFRYNAQSSEAQVLTQAIFGQNVSQLKHNTRETLSALMESAIKEMDIDIEKAVKFI